MGIADSMKDLSDRIITSHNMRIRALGDLVIDTKKTLQDFAEERQNMGRKQAKDLAGFVNSLSKSVDNMLKDFHKGHKKMSSEQARNLSGFSNNLVKNTEKMLNQFLKDHRQMSREQAKNLSDFVAKLTNNVHAMIGDFHKDHQHMSDDQAKNLSDFVNDLTRDVSTMVNSFRKTRGEMSTELKNKLASDVKNIETYVKDKLNEFEKSHGRMSDDLRKNLSAYANDMARGIRKLLQEYRADMGQARSSWETISTLTGLNIETAAASVEVKEKVSTVREAIEKEEPEQKEVIPEVEVEGRVLEYINKHPEGVKVGNMEIALGLPRMKLGMKAKKLLEEGRVRKEANLYYPLGAFQGASFMVPGSGFSTETH
jgi:hypothetical protein